jgi:hypothetical protein
MLSHVGSPANSKKLYKLNYNDVQYNFYTNTYFDQLGSCYTSYWKAKETQWKCEKCNEAFRNMRMLKSHKWERHSY